MRPDWLPQSVTPGHVFLWSVVAFVVFLELAVAVIVVLGIIGAFG